MTLDRILINILVENLIRNAYDALRDWDAGEVSIQAQIEGNTCLIRISNTGPGIPAEDREKIWEPGWTTKRKLHEGYSRGLGLPLCRQIAMAHEGTLALDTQPSKAGTTFIIRLPVSGPRSWMQG